MADPKDDNKGFKIVWSNSINIGHVLTMAGMAGLAIAAWYARDTDLALLHANMIHLEKQQDQQDIVNATQDARWTTTFLEIKQDIRDLRTQVESAIQRTHMP